MKQATQGKCRARSRRETPRRICGRRGGRLSRGAAEVPLS